MKLFENRATSNIFQLYHNYVNKIISVLMPGDTVLIILLSQFKGVGSFFEVGG